MLPSSTSQKHNDLLTILALTERSVHHEKPASELRNRARQLAADRLVSDDIDLPEVIDELEISQK
ncbi:hypothetical protein DVR14_24500 (plasmid) [Natrinema thermotolerans]|nr:hypothetical protein DVR14_24500 [Natrinema thermotolerans]